MSSLTEDLYRALVALPTDEVSAQGARLVYEIWSRAEKSRPGAARTAGARARLAATDALTGSTSAETAAFDNAFRFAEAQCKDAAAPTDVAVERACCGALVFAATALAEARGANCATLFNAVGLGLEAYTRLAEGLANGTRRKGFDACTVAAPLAAIVACAAIEKLPPDKAAQALGLGSSAVTGVADGYVPLQAATAARDGIVMALLMACGFRGPPDPVACRWGIYDTFAEPKDAGSLDVHARHAKAAQGMQHLFGSPAAASEKLLNSHGTVPVAKFLEALAAGALVTA